MAIAERENHYVQRINRVLDYIAQNLTEDLSLETLADTACFSQFHFHRIFKIVVGENLNRYIIRTRLERAARVMKSSPSLPISKIAFDCGFSSPSDFSRSFKKEYDIAPSKWNTTTPLRKSKICKDYEPFGCYTWEDFERLGAVDEFPVTIRSFAPVHVAYVRFADSYTFANLYNAHDTLVAWYKQRFGSPEVGTMIGMSQDDPDITPAKQCRYDICVTVPKGTEGEGDVGVRLLPGCTVASVHCAGDIYKVDRAWQYLFNYWLPRSNYQPDNLPGMEVFRKTPEEIGWEVYDLEGCIPVIPL